MPKPYVVTSAEAGQKLLYFLARRFELPHSAFHRWIRTGQVRVNGRRSGAFDRVQAGDEIRVPPFATAGRADTGEARLPFPQIVAETEEFLLLCKPAGLPVHPGSGHQDSLTQRIRARYTGADFLPTPVHRLDRDTSGLLLVAKTYRAVRRLSDMLAAHNGQVVKEYLAWVSGICPWTDPIFLADGLVKDSATPGGPERVYISPTGVNARQPVREAGLTVCCLTRSNGISLVLIRLHTGRTHQIRAQLSSRGFPLLGDGKYGGPFCAAGLLLHAARLIVDGQVYESLPSWPGKLRVTGLPPVALLDSPAAPII